LSAFEPSWSGILGESKDQADLRRKSALVSALELVRWTDAKPSFRLRFDLPIVNLAARNFPDKVEEGDGRSHQHFRNLLTQPPPPRTFQLHISDLKASRLVLEDPLESPQIYFPAPLDIPVAYLY